MKTNQNQNPNRNLEPSNFEPRTLNGEASGRSTVQRFKVQGSKFLCILPLLALVAGCSSVGKITPALVQQGAATAVSYGVEKYPTAIPYIKVAGAVICSAANGTNISPAEVVAAVEASNAGALKTPESVLILNGALLLYTGLWESYGADAVTEHEKLQLYLQATCNGIHDGLPDAARGRAPEPRNWPLIALPR